MADPAQQLFEDRALRDAARELVRNDLDFIRHNVAARSVPARLADRVMGGAHDIADEAAMVAKDNRTLLGTGLAAAAIGLAAWVYRKPLEAGLDQLIQRAGTVKRINPFG